MSTEKSERVESQTATMGGDRPSGCEDDAERLWIARELHDRVAHGLSVALHDLELAELRELCSPEVAVIRRVAAQRTVRDVLEYVRSLASGLRRTPRDGYGDDPVVLADLPAAEPPRATLVTSVRNEMFLVLREALRNALVHSEAEHVVAELRVIDGAVEATVVDDGAGFDVREEEQPGRGTGLASMRERTELLGGTLDLTSTLGRTRVSVRVPLHRAAHG